MLLSNVLKINSYRLMQKSLAVIQLGFFIFSCAPAPKKTLTSDTKPIAEICPVGFTDVSLSKKNWKIEYKSDGRIDFYSDQIFMAPKPVHLPQHTLSTLVLSKFDIVSDNFEIIVDYKNLAALRKHNPNPWEVFWLLFNYVPGAGDVKTANYVVAKTNGIEMGRAAKIIDQTYIKTADYPKATFDEWHRLRVHKIDDALKIYFNDEFVFAIPVNQLFTAPGKIGLYSEDASVVVKRVCLNSDIQLRH